MSTRFLLMRCVIASLTLSCATAPAPVPDPVPDWAATPSAIREVYPDSDFIAREGSGATLEAAKANAAAEIARFFTSEISALSGGRASMIQQNGEITEILEIINDAVVRSQIDLFGIRYTEDAFYNKAEKDWQTLAYIDRNEAWTVYEPRFKRQADAFEAFYAAAEQESGQFRKALRFGAVAAYMRSEGFVEDFVKKEVFGQILHSQKMSDSFDGIRAEIAAIPQKIDDAKRNASVFIDCPGDFETRVTNAFSQALSAEGFPVAKNRNGADVVCAVAITEGRQQRELGIFYNPSLQAVFTGASGALFTFNAAADRASAVTPDVAKRRAYTALADKVKGTFSIEGN
jgi:hypothetical protein